MLVNLLLNTQLFAKEKNLQFSVGQSIKVYSEKAYKRNKGQLFEAVGNVVIISGTNTLYGEKASIDFKDSIVRVIGNVRFISSDITVYGSSIVFSLKSESIQVENARVVTSDFNIVADSLKKVAPKKFHAIKAQFTTCKDCVESWSIYGEDIFVELDQYVQIHHALTRIKGVSVLYFPYIALPIKTVRESGLLFPQFSSEISQGISYAQPYFLNLGLNKDITFTPKLMGKRGFGMDFEYRHVFDEGSWLTINDRAVSDSIYLPGKTSDSLSGTEYLRNFYHIENHYMFSDNLVSHIELTESKDMDLFSDSDFNFNNDYLRDSDIGFYGFLNYRSDSFDVGIRSTNRKSLVNRDTLDFDNNYVQIQPSLHFNLKPHILTQSELGPIQKISFGLDSEYSRFSQDVVDQTFGIRNTMRLDATPYLDIQLFDIGPVHLSSFYTFDSQYYNLYEQDKKTFAKYANVFRTKASFAIQQVFGTASANRVKKKNLSLAKKKEASDLIGSLPKIKADEDLDYEIKLMNSYKHTQEFNFIHHYILSDNEYGNKSFEKQIMDNSGWFDYRDAYKRDLATRGLNDVRTQIPVLNTLEFQWNNNLIKKAPTQIAARDYSGFNYTNIGYFNISQGVLLEDKDLTFKERLTRLFISTGYNIGTVNLSMNEYYFHQDFSNKLDINVEKRFSFFNFLTSYNYNSLTETKIETVKVGAQIRPIESFGFSALQEYDLQASNSIKSIYQMDVMPDNNCWILNFRYGEYVEDKRFSINFQFNFGNESFARYKSDYFSYSRL